MWRFRILRLFLKSLGRCAAALEDIRDLYRLDLASRGITQTNPTVHDEVEVQYGSIEPEREP